MKYRNILIAICLILVLLVPFGYYEPTPANAQSSTSGPSVQQLGSLLSSIGGLVGGQFGGILSSIGGLMSNGLIGGLLGGGGIGGLVGGLGGLAGGSGLGGGLGGGTGTPSSGNTGSGGGGGGRPVSVVSDSSATSIQRTRNIALIERSNATIAEQITSLTLKETQLDPAAWNTSKQLQQQLTANMLKWLGGQMPGQNGQVPFIQNYSDHWAAVRVNVVGEFISGDKISGLCSEEENFKVKEYVYNSYMQSRNNDRPMFQCRENTSAAPGTPTAPGISALDNLLATSLECSDVTCASFYADYKLAVEEANAFANEDKVTNLTRGMLPQRLCREVSTGTANGTSTTERRCDLVNPPFLTADTVSFQMTEMPGLQLLNTDEYNEIVANTMSNLSNQAVQSPTGILGMSGNPAYSFNIFGAGGNLSYVDALGQDNVQDYKPTANSPIKEALRAGQVFAVMLIEILYEVASLEDKLIEESKEFEGCFDVTLTAQLKEAKTMASSSLSVATTSLSILIVLDKEYDAAADASAESAILNAFMGYRNQGLFRVEYQNEQFRVTYLDTVFAEAVANFKIEIEAERQRCIKEEEEEKEKEENGP